MIPSKLETIWEDIERTENPGKWPIFQWLGIFFSRAVFLSFSCAQNCFLLSFLPSFFLSFSFFLSLFLFCWAWEQIQGLAHIRQVSTLPLSYTPSPHWGSCKKKGSDLRDLWTCISSRLPGDADGAALQTSLWGARQEQVWSQEKQKVESHYYPQDWWILRRSKDTLS